MLALYMANPGLVASTQVAPWVWLKHTHAPKILLVQQKDILLKKEKLSAYTSNIGLKSKVKIL